MPNLFLLTLTWNACDKLTKLKETLIPNLNGLNWKWIIKDNNSKDDTFEVASQWGNNVHVVKYPDNKQNFAQGVNFCFHEANPKDEDMILLLNNDIIFNDTTSIKNMITCLKDDVGAVGARLLYTGTNRLQHAGVVIDPNFRAPIHFRAGDENDEHSEKNRYFQSITGALLLMRAGDFRKIHTNASGICGMDENYHWAFEDIDVCLKLKHDLNKKIVYCGKTNIFHEESASLKKNPVNKMFQNHNLDYFRSKWMSKFVIDRVFYERDKNYALVE
jgi:O-antigen biosynthesis protein